MKKKQIIIGALAAALLTAGGLRAQESTADGRDYHGELAISMYGPAAAGLPFDGNIGWKDKSGVALGFGADYTHWFNDHVGLVAGLKLSYISSRQESGAFSEEISGTLPVTGLGDQSVLLKASATDVVENKAMGFVEIPVRLALELNDFYCNLGASLSLAVSNFSEYTYTISGYALEEVTSMGVTMSTPVPLQLEDQQKDDILQSRDHSWPLYVLVGGELGYRFRFDERNAVSVGLYGRYAVLQSKPDGDKQAFRLVDNQIAVNRPSATSHLDKMGYYEFGLRIAYHYGVRK